MSHTDKSATESERLVTMKFIQDVVVFRCVLLYFGALTVFGFDSSMSFTSNFQAANFAFRNIYYFYACGERCFNWRSDLQSTIFTSSQKGPRVDLTLLYLVAFLFLLLPIFFLLLLCITRGLLIITFLLIFLMNRKEGIIDNN